MGVDERKRLERAVRDRRRLLEEIEDLVRVREELLSATSHDLRTPLSAMRLRLQTLERAARSPGDRFTPEWVLEVAGKVIASIDAMAGMLDQIREQSRAERDRIPLDVDACDLVEVAREVAEERRAFLGAPVRVRGEDECPGRWDRLRLSQVVARLLENAASRAPGQVIDVSVEKAGAICRLTVTDRGPRLDEEARAQLFRFHRGRPTAGPRGLGLWIVDRIAQLLGGSVAVESGENGTSFVVDLPRAGPG